MTLNFLTLLQTLFSQCWKFFNSWYIPGTNITPAGAGFFILFAFFVIRFAKKLLSNNDEG